MMVYTMSESSFNTIERLLASDRADEVDEGLELVKKEISHVGGNEAKPLFELVASLFYIDTLDRPDLVPALNEAISLVAGFGEWVIPVLVRKLEQSDIKAQIASAHALGRIGADAIGPLLAEYQATTNLASRIFILYALGKIKSPRILEAFSVALEAAEASDVEMRDTATRVLGKFVEAIPPTDLPEQLQLRALKVLQKNLSSEDAGIRSKAVRSLGKLAKTGHLSEAEKKQLRAILDRILGRDDYFEWDRAYVVRREAEEALRHLD
jgi:hypothetical protein